MKNKEYLAEMNTAYREVTKLSTPEQIEEADKSAKEKAALTNAIGSLSAAIDYLKKADKLVKTDDYKRFISEIESVISSDGGEAGLESILKNM